MPIRDVVITWRHYHYERTGVIWQDDACHYYVRLLLSPRYHGYIVSIGVGLAIDGQMA